MFQLHRFFSVIIIALLSINFYLISKYAGFLQEKISGKFNSFQSLIFEINHLTSALSPLLIFTFIYVTTSIILSHLAIEKQRRSLSKIIALAFIPILLFSTAYLVLIKNFVSEIDDISGQDIKNLNMVYDYTFNDFKNIGYIFWVMFYLILISKIKLSYETTYLTSLAICLIPSTILLLFIELF